MNSHWFANRNLHQLRRLSQADQRMQGEYTQNYEENKQNLGASQTQLDTVATQVSTLATDVSLIQAENTAQQNAIDDIVSNLTPVPLQYLTSPLLTAMEPLHHWLMRLNAVNVIVDQHTATIDADHTPRILALEGDVTTVQSDLSTLQTDQVDSHNTLLSGVNSNSSSITTLQSEVDSLTTALTTLQQTVTQLQNATPSGVPTGTIAIWMTLSIPTGWILCEGQNLVSPEHDDLIAVLGQNTAPDYRGMFLRGSEPRAAGDGGNIPHQEFAEIWDPLSIHECLTSLPTYTPMYTSTGGDHTHQYQDLSCYNDYSYIDGGSYGPQPGQFYTRTTAANGAHSHTLMGGDPETVPKHKIVKYIIKI